MDPILLFAFGTTGLVTLGAMLVLRREARRGADPAWRALARENGGTFETGLLGPVVRLERDGVRVMLQAIDKGRGHHETRATGRRDESVWWEGPRFEGSVEELVAEPPHPAFADRESLRLLAAVAGSQIRVDDVMGATLQWKGLEAHQPVLASAVQIVTRLARLPRYGPLHELGGARRVGQRRDAVQLEVNGARAEIAGTRWGDRDGVVITVPCARELPRFALEIDAEGELSGDPAPGLLRGGEAKPPSGLGVARLKLDGEQLRLYLRPPLRVEDLEAAVRWTASLADGDPGRGAFR